MPKVFLANAWPPGSASATSPATAADGCGCADAAEEGPEEKEAEEALGAVAEVVIITDGCTLLLLLQVVVISAEGKDEAEERKDEV